jgi:alginate O-acetyltransferase complex protein AlgI
MYFNTLEYFGFFLLVWAALRYVPGPATVLFVASIIFYIVAGWFDTTLIALLIVANWLLLSYVSTPKLRIILAVIVNVGVLVAVKYRVLLGGDPGDDPTAFVDMVLPLGISFYTFQLLAYQIDTARDASLRERDPRTFALFIIFFPQLIAGPIVRARQLLPQIRALSSKRSPRLRLYSYGLLLCALGLSKKILFADSLSPIVDDIFYLGPTSTGEAWTGAWLFTFQIYFDFSGYSDIAIGSAYLLGIRLPRNFQTPYLSTTPREFWRRWHITLSTWIRDYLYIPLGGSKGLRTQQYAVLVMVMGIAGLWHGANSTFVIWGGRCGGCISRCTVFLAG